MFFLGLTEPVERPLRGGFERTQIVFDHHPYAARIRLCRIRVVRSFPGHARWATEQWDKVAPPLPPVRIARLQIFLVSVKVHSPRKLFDEDDVFNDIREALDGSLEGTNRFCLDVLLHARFQRTFLDKFDRAAQHPRELRLHPHKV